MKLGRVLIHGLVFLSVAGCSGLAEHGYWMKPAITRAEAAADAYGCLVIATSSNTRYASTTLEGVRHSPSPSSDTEFSPSTYGECLEGEGYEWVPTNPTPPLAARHHAETGIGIALSATDMQRAVAAASQTLSPPDGFTVNLPDGGIESFRVPLRSGE